MKVSDAHIMPYHSRGVANAIPKDNKEWSTESISKS